MAVPSQIAVLGAGSWGTALAILLCHTTSEVTLWGRDGAQIKEMARSRVNHRYLAGVSFPDNLTLTADFNSLSGFSDFLLVVPSKAFKSTLLNLFNLLNGGEITPHKITPHKITLVSATKGFDPQSSELLGALVKEVFGNTAIFAVISGPSFAKETAAGLPTAFTLASSNLQHAREISGWFSTPTTRVYFSDDPVGVQLGGAIKNVMAIASGISDGLGYGANSRAALITRGLSELSRLGVALGGKPETFMGLTGVGDLILTCTDNQSRNRRYGLGLGKGLSADKVLAEINQEVEGINTVSELFKLSQKHHIEMPITEQVYRIVHQGAQPAQAVRQLLNRTYKSE